MTNTNKLATRGRPKLSDKGARCYESRLFLFLEQRLTHYQIRNRLNVAALAADTKYRPQTLYKWFGQERISPDAAARIVGVARGAFTLEDMVPFFVSQ